MSSITFSEFNCSLRGLGDPQRGVREDAGVFSEY